MKEKDVIRSLLHANGGKIYGRTAIQKLVYLSGKMIAELQISPYMAHYYGPFSAGVEQTLGDLVSYRFVSETREPNIDYVGYNYELTSDGREVMEKKVLEKNKELYGKIKNVIEICKEYCNNKLSINELSVAAKVHYMLETQDEGKNGMTADEASKKARRLNWKITSETAEQGAELLVKLGLVKRQ